MSAMLGLAASDLAAQDPSLVEFGVRYRLKAIKGIKRTLSESIYTDSFEEGNALIATCFVLAFQSALLGDGLVEFMTFCRGIVIVARKMHHRNDRVMFTNFAGEDQMKLTSTMVENVPKIPKAWTDMAMAAIRKLEPLFQDPVDRAYRNNLLGIATALTSSSHLGW